MNTSRFRYVLAERNAMAALIATLVVMQTIALSLSEDISEHTMGLKRIYVGAVIKKGQGNLANYIKMTSRTIIDDMENVTPANINTHFQIPLSHTSQGFRSLFAQHAIKDKDLMQKQHVVSQVKLFLRTEKLEDNEYSIYAQYEIRDSTSEKTLMKGIKKFYIRWSSEDSGEPVFDQYTYKIVKGDKVP